jgi:hypothetical protein
MGFRKLYILALIPISFCLLACEEETGNETTSPHAIVDVIPPTIILDGNSSDTAYLYEAYSDPGAEIRENKLNNCDFVYAIVTGSVNTHIPGIYYLRYNGSDTAGNAAAQVTRTVHVVENPLGFFMGIYDAACSCTATISHSTNPKVVSTDTYSATISSGRVRSQFSLMPLKVGAGFVVPSIFIKDNLLSVHFFDPNFDLNTSSSGTLSPSKNSFSITTTAYQYMPRITYQCENVYTKRVIQIAENK